MASRQPYTVSPFGSPVGVSGFAPRRRPSALARWGYVAAWAGIGFAGTAGLAFSLYRNDVLLGLARGAGIESRYLELERRYLGKPGWGTPRSLAPATATALSAAPGVGARVTTPAVTPVAPPTVAPTVAAPSTVAPSAAAPPQQPAEPAPARATSEGVAIISLDALPAATAAPAAPPPSQPERARRATAPTPVAPAAAKPPARAAAPKAAPAPAPAAATPPPPVNENPLKAAIRSAINKETGK